MLSSSWVYRTRSLASIQNHVNVINIILNLSICWWVMTISHRPLGTPYYSRTRVYYQNETALTTAHHVGKVWVSFLHTTSSSILIGLIHEEVYGLAGFHTFKNIVMNIYRIPQDIFLQAITQSVTSFIGRYLSWYIPTRVERVLPKTLFCTINCYLRIYGRYIMVCLFCEESHALC